MSAPTDAQMRINQGGEDKPSSERDEAGMCIGCGATSVVMSQSPPLIKTLVQRNTMTNNDNSADGLSGYRIVQNAVCRCGNLYQYRDWEDDETDCPSCGRLNDYVDAATER